MRRPFGRVVIAFPIHVADTYDVAVIGAGIAGLASSIFLQKAGLRVVCVDSRAYPHHKVGESLDWSSPNMLQRVGIPREALIDDQIATYKKGIMICEPGKEDWDVQPPPSIQRSPFRFEVLTLHVDRTALDQRLYEEALALGTTFVWDRVTDVECEGDRVRGCLTAKGRRVTARHYIDASGTALVFARAMNIPTEEYGRTKVCLWTYFKTPPLQGGTTFFLDSRDDYLNWIWDIPISPTETSIGLVASADSIKSQRRAGRSLRTILTTELSRHKRFDALLAEQSDFDVKTTSFRPYVTTRVAGPNWFMAGESASMPDPLTGNGLTSGIRHAQWATDEIRAAGSAAEIAPLRTPPLQPPRAAPRPIVQRAHGERHLPASDAMGVRDAECDADLHVVRVLHERALHTIRSAWTARDGGLRRSLSDRADVDRGVVDASA